MGADGEKESKKFFDSLAGSKFFRGQGRKIQAKLLTLFQNVADSGDYHNRSRFGPEDDGFWAFKCEAMNKLIRIPCFQIGNTWVLTHGFYKQGAQKGRGKWRKEEIDKANRLMAEYLSLIKSSRLTNG